VLRHEDRDIPAHLAFRSHNGFLAFVSKVCEPLNPILPIAV